MRLDISETQGFGNKTLVKEFITEVGHKNTIRDYLIVLQIISGSQLTTKETFAKSLLYRECNFPLEIFYKDLAEYFENILNKQYLISFSI